jgi:hypothetical protein
MSINIKREKLYNYAIYLWFILYALSIFGIYTKAPKYLLKLDFYLKLYIGGFLVIRYNPFFSFVGDKLESFDKKLIFSGGLFILLTTILTILLVPKEDRQNILKQTYDVKKIIEEKII